MAGLTKEMLASRKVRHMLKEPQLWLNIGFDLEEDHLTADYLGVDLRKLPKVQLTDQIFQNDSKDSSTHNLIRMTWFPIFRNQKFEITGRYLKKVKRCEL